MILANTLGFFLLLPNLKFVPLFYISNNLLKRSLVQSRNQCSS